MKLSDRMGSAEGRPSEHVNTFSHQNERAPRKLFFLIAWIPQVVFIIASEWKNLGATNYDQIYM